MQNIYSAFFVCVCFPVFFYGFSFAPSSFVSPIDLPAVCSEEFDEKCTNVLTAFKKIYHKSLFDFSYCSFTFSLPRFVCSLSPFFSFFIFIHFLKHATLFIFYFAVKPYWFSVQFFVCFPFKVQGTVTVYLWANSLLHHNGTQTQWKMQSPKMHSEEQQQCQLH